MSSTTIRPRLRIAIIGVGQVGGAAAYGLILRSVTCDLLLVDNNIALRDSQVHDLTDVAYTTKSSTRIQGGNYHEAGQCDIIVITAGSRHTIGQSGLDAASRNVSIVRNVVDALCPVRPDAILLVVSNPVDLLTTLALERSRLPPEQVIGAGTFLDSARLRALMAGRIGIASNSIDVYVIGVHGESEVAAWSTATVGGIPIDQTISPEAMTERAELEEQCRQQGRAIVQAKGSTPFGMGSVVASICASIALDKRNVKAVSHWQPEYECCFSLPVVLGRKGIVRNVEVPLNEEEKAKIEESVGTLKKQLELVRRGL
ncbi:lactate dehydrogenase [Cercophora newfieldiana]|uniref:Lactate dehydrogenase n=1 Tax=Cercophora newfieldiana TaxID=92897 RepID=A0AA40CKJ1_9PEZI|nr:lactate dehydrogenase [Cercophora newfieldiana]